jgi:uncharacterized damage-inducible protein DinB
MSALDQVRALYGYNEWANGHVLDAASSLSDDELDRKLGASYDSVRGNLSHIAGAQIIWLGRWTGAKSGALPLLSGEASIADVRRAFEVSHRELRDFVATLTDETLEGTARYRDTREENQQNVLWKLMLQVANHGTHHRAETALLLTALGHAPRQLDYIFYEIEAAGGAPRLT